MSYTYKTKARDNARQITHTLRLQGRPLDLTDATVEFIAQHTTDATAYIARSAVVVDATKGKVRFKFTSDETKVPGLYNTEWRITYQDGSILTVPDDDVITLEIVKGVKKHGNV
jgi:hypothetical protein